MCCKHFMDFYFRAQLQKTQPLKPHFATGLELIWEFIFFILLCFFVFGLGGFARVLFPLGFRLENVHFLGFS